MDRIQFRKANTQLVTTRSGKALNQVKTTNGLTRVAQRSIFLVILRVDNIKRCTKKYSLLRAAFNMRLFVVEIVFLSRLYWINENS